MPGGSEGPNWILLAGGAAVTALSYLIRRRQKHEFEDTEEDGERKSGKAQRANYDDGFEPDYWGIETPEACPHQDSVENAASTSLTHSKHSGLPIAPALSRGTSTGLADALLADNPRDSKQSPPSVEFTEQENRFQRRDTFSHEGVRHSNQQGVQIGRTAKRDMVHRLRKQLKSRDEMILRMQVQISENERSSSLSDAHVSELQSRLEATSRVLSNLDLEVQLFRNQLLNFVKCAPRTENCNESTAGGAESATTFGQEHRDMNVTLLEFTKLREVLDRLKMETTAREIERQSLLQEYNSMVEKVGHLECALKEQTTLVSEKEQALNKTQEELLRLTSRLQVQDTNLTLMELTKLKEALDRLKMETTAREIERQALLQEYNSMVEKVDHLECALKEQTTLASEKEQALNKTQEELLRLTSRLQVQIEEMEPFSLLKAKLETCIYDLNSSGLSLRALHNSQEIISSTSTEVSYSSSHLPQGQEDPEVIHTGHEFKTNFPENIKDPAVIDSVVTALQLETEQLTADLASESKVNELNINSIELAKCKRLEDEMADIRKYDTKISELRRNNSNLTQDSIDEVRNEQSLHVAALICSLAEKVAAQEEQAKQTALEVQQLSTSFQLLTPIVAKLQDKNADIPLMAQPNPAEMVSYDIQMKFNSSSVVAKHVTEGSNTSWTGSLGHGRQDSDASASSMLSKNQISPDYMVDDDYHFRVGASGPLAVKSRKFSSKLDGKNGRRKKSFTHDYGSGSDADIVSSGNWASTSEGDKDLYRQKHVNVDVPQYLQHSLGSVVEFQDSESRSIPVEEEKNGHNARAVQQKDRYAPLEVDQVMATSTPDANFVPIVEEYSPYVRQVRSPRQGIESSRRYLFNVGNNRDNHANSLEASTATAAESSLEEPLSVRSFSVEHFEASPISPLSKMMTQLDSTEELPETSSLQEDSVELLLPDSPQDVVEDETRSFKEGNSSSMDWSIVTSGTDEYDANSSTKNRLIVSEDVDVSEANAPVANMLTVAQDTNDAVSESGSEERGSIDSEFEEILDGTLDDLVKIFSTTVTPASTPRSSVLSHNSESKKIQ